MYYARKLYKNGKYEVVKASGGRPLSMTKEELLAFSQNETVYGVSDDSIVCYPDYEACCQAQTCMIPLIYGGSDFVVKVADDGSCWIDTWNGNVQRVILPDCITDIQPVDAFRGMQSIEMTDNVQYIAQAAFKDCKNLQHIRFSADIKQLSHSCFEGAVWHGQEPFVIPDTIHKVHSFCFRYFKCRTLLFEDNVYCTTDAFNKCAAQEIVFTSPHAFVELGCFRNSRTERIVLPSGMIRIGKYTFHDCKQLREVVLPEKLQIIDDNAFVGCSQLSVLELPSGVMQIGIAAFRWCSSLTDIQFPAGLRFIKKQAFMNCDSLKTLVFPKTMQVIESNAFAECKNLETIVLPEYMGTLHSEAFADCPSLKSITFPRHCDGVGKNIIDREDMTGLKVRVYKDSAMHRKMLQEYRQGEIDLEIIEG